MNYMVLVLTICLASSSFQEKTSDDKIKKFLKDLEDNDSNVREEATKKLIDLWEEDSLRDQLKEILTKAKAEKRFELQFRAQFILDRVMFRWALGKKLVYKLGNEINGLFEKGDESCNLFQTWLKDQKTREKNNLEDPKKQQVLAKWVVDQIKTNQQKISLIWFIKNEGLKGCASSLKVLLDDEGMVLGKGEETYVKAEAAEAIGELKLEIYTEEVALLLKNLVPQVRSSAIIALTRLDPLKYEKDIVNFLSDESETVRATAISALASIDAKKHLKIISKLFDDKSSTVRSALVPIMLTSGEKGYIKKVVDSLEKEDDLVKWRIINTIGDQQLRELTPVVVKCLKGSAWLKMRAIDALAELGAKDHIKDIASLIYDMDFYVGPCSPRTPDPNNLETVGTIAVKALGALCAKEYSKELAALLKDKNYTMWESIVATFRKFGKETFKDIVPLLKDKDANVRASALLALEALDAKEYTREVSELLNDHSSVTLSLCDQVLSKIAARCLKGWGIDPKAN